MRKITKQEFENKINEIYNYKYSLISDYNNNNTSITIQCNDCGYKEEITPKQLKKGTHKCRKCSFDLYSLDLDDLQDEIWLPIEGFEYYLISNKGRVKTIDHMTIDNNQKIKEHIKIFNIKLPGGYVEGELRDSFGKRHWASMHRLVAQAFVYNPDPEKYTEVNHIDGNKLNNTEENLEWTDRSGNIQHGIKTGLYSRDKMLDRLDRATEASRKKYDNCLLLNEKNIPIFQSTRRQCCYFATGKSNCNYKIHLDKNELFKNFYWKTITKITL